MPPGRKSAAGRKFLAPPYYSQRAMLSAFFIHLCFKSLLGCRPRQSTLSKAQVKKNASLNDSEPAGRQISNTRNSPRFLQQSCRTDVHCTAMLWLRVSLRQYHRNNVPANSAFDYDHHKCAVFRSVLFRLEGGAYLTGHANVEAKPRLLAQCITFCGSEGSG